MIEIQVKDHITGKGAKVTEDRALLVANVPVPPPPEGTPNKLRYLTTFLGQGGNPASNNHNVDGSATPVEFYIGAAEDYDIYVMKLAILIADAAITHNEFGDVGTLTNGWDLKSVESGDVTLLIDKAKTGGQIIAQSGFSDPYGTTADTWELTNWSGTSDAMTVSIPIAQYIPGGIRLGRGTNDRIVSVVNDNLTGLDEMWVRVFGYRHYPVTDGED